MIHPTWRDQKSSFWSQGQWFFLWNEAVEVIEATEFVEAVEVIKAAEFSNSRESLKKNSATQESQTTFKPNLTCIFLSTRPK